MPSSRGVVPVELPVFQTPPQREFILWAPGIAPRPVVMPPRVVCARFTLVHTMHVQRWDAQSWNRLQSPGRVVLQCSSARPEVTGALDPPLLLFKARMVVVVVILCPPGFHVLLWRPGAVVLLLLGTCRGLHLAAVTASPQRNRRLPHRKRRGWRRRPTTTQCQEQGGSCYDHALSMPLRHQLP